MGCLVLCRDGRAALVLFLQANLHFRRLLVIVPVALGVMPFLLVFSPPVGGFCIVVGGRLDTMCQEGMKRANQILTPEYWPYWLVVFALGCAGLLHRAIVSRCVPGAERPSRSGEVIHALSVLMILLGAYLAWAHVIDISSKEPMRGLPGKDYLTDKHYQEQNHELEEKRKNEGAISSQRSKKFEGALEGLDEVNTVREEYDTALKELGTALASRKSTETKIQKTPKTLGITFATFGNPEYDDLAGKLKDLENKIPGFEQALADKSSELDQSLLSYNTSLVELEWSDRDRLIFTAWRIYSLLALLATGWILVTAFAPGLAVLTMFVATATIVNMRHEDVSSSSTLAPFAFLAALAILFRMLHLGCRHNVALVENWKKAALGGRGCRAIILNMAILVTFALIPKLLQDAGGDLFAEAIYSIPDIAEDEFLVERYPFEPSLEGNIMRSIDRHEVRVNHYIDDDKNKFNESLKQKIGSEKGATLKKIIMDYIFDGHEDQEPLLGKRLWDLFPSTKPQYGCIDLIPFDMSFKPVCYIKDRIKEYMDRLYRNARAVPRNALDAKLDELVAADIPITHKDVVNTLMESNAAAFSVVHNGVSSAFFWIRVWQMIALLLMTYALIRGGLAIIGRSVFQSRRFPAQKMHIAAMNTDDPGDVVPSRAFVMSEAPDVDIFVRRSYDVDNAPPDLCLPQWRASPLSRIFHGYYVMNRVRANQLHEASIMLTGGQHFAVLPLRAGQKFCLRSDRIVAFSANIRLKKHIDFSIVASSFNRVLFLVADIDPDFATGAPPGKIVPSPGASNDTSAAGIVVLRCDGAARTHGREISESFNPGRLLAWQSNCKFAIRGNPHPVDTYLSGSQLAVGPDSFAIVDAQIPMRGRWRQGLIRLFPALALPV